MVEADPLEVVDQLGQQFTLLPWRGELTARLVGGGEERGLQGLQAGLQQLGVEPAGRHEAAAECPPQLGELTHTGEGGVKDLQYTGPVLQSHLGVISIMP